jgi:hypothetical protein
MRRRINGPKITGSDDNFARGCLFGLILVIPLWIVIFLIWWWA